MLRCALVICVLLCLAGLLAACSSASPETTPGPAPLPAAARPLPEAQPDASAPAQALPSLSTLDGMAEARPRAASEICEIGNFEARAYLAKSANAFLLENGQLLLPSPPGGVSWVVYEAFNAGSEISSAVMFASVVEAGYYIALPDFETGRWQLGALNPSNDNPFSIQLDDPARISPKHRQYFAVLAVDGGQFIVDSMLSNIKCRSPHSSNIDTAAIEGIEVADCGGRPGVCFSNIDNQLVFGLAADDSPGGPEDWQLSRIDPDRFGFALSMTMHKGRPVVLYASSEDASLWLGSALTQQPQSDSDWQHRQLLADAECEYCSIVSDGQRLHIAWFHNDAANADLDGYWSYLYYGYSASDDPQDSFSSYRLRNLGNVLYAEFAQPALAIVDGEPAIAIVNVVPGVESQLLFMQASDPSPGLAEWDSQILTTDAEPPFVTLSLLNGRPLVCYRNALLRGLQGKLARPQLAADWNRSDLSGATPYPSFAWLAINERPFYAFVSDLAGPLQIACYGGSPSRFIPQDDVIEEVQTLSGNIVEPGGDALLRMAEIAGQPVMVYYDSADGSLTYVQLPID